MLAANNKSSERRLAWEAEKAEAPFICPSCQGVAILKKGKKKAHHFAHKPPVNCEYGQGESEIHYKAKREIYEALRNYPGCSECGIERIFPGVRPDVSLKIHNDWVAIEIQKSDIDIDTIQRRTSRYRDLGVSILWVSPQSSPALFSYSQTLPGCETWANAKLGCATERVREVNVCRLREWEKYLHRLYLLKLYYWQGGATVKAIHFDNLKTYVPVRSWFVDGDKREAGGYTKTLKTIMEPFELGRKLHIADDFFVAGRQFYRGIPACRLWEDTNDAWWE